MGLLFQACTKQFLHLLIGVTALGLSAESVLVEGILEDRSYIVTRSFVINGNIPTCVGVSGCYECGIVNRINLAVNANFTKLGLDYLSNTSPCGVGAGKQGDGLPVIACFLQKFFGLINTVIEVIFFVPFLKVIQITSVSIGAVTLPLPS